MTLVIAACTTSPHRHDRASTVRPSTAPPTSAARGVTGTVAGAGTASAAPSSSPPARRTVTVLGSGDVLIHPPLWEQAAADAHAEGRQGYDFGPIYASVAPDVAAASLAICELETPLARASGPFSGWPDFNAPPQVLTTLKQIGYDSCTTASNHSLDQGFAGVKRTLDEVDAAGLRHTGSARSAAEAATPLIITTANGVKIAQLAYAFGFNGIPLPAGQPWLANLTSVPAILAAAHRARRAGADIVVLSMHWGTEYQHAPTDEQVQQAHELLASPDIDLILGAHTHVVQPMDRINGKWVEYGMGNQISRHADPINDNREGVMPEFTFTEVTPGHWAVTRATAFPTWMQLTPALRLIDLHRSLADPSVSGSARATYMAAEGRIKGYLNQLGALGKGLTVAG